MSHGPEGYTPAQATELWLFRCVHNHLSVWLFDRPVEHHAKSEEYVRHAGWGVRDTWSSRGYSVSWSQPLCPVPDCEAPVITKVERPLRLRRQLDAVMAAYLIGGWVAALPLVRGSSKSLRHAEVGNRLLNAPAVIAKRVVPRRYRPPRPKGTKPKT